MKSISCNYRLLSTSFLMLTFLLGCLKRESDAESINLEFLIFSSVFYNQCPPSYNNAKNLPLNISESQANSEQKLYRVQRSSTAATTKLTITINSSCTSYIRDIEYCDNFNQKKSTNDLVNCDSGKGAMNGYITGDPSDQEICDINYPATLFYLWVSTSSCQISILPEEV